MSVILWKIIIVSIILVMTMIGAFLGWHVLRLMKRVKQVQADRDKALEAWYKLLRAKPMLEELEKKMILASLNMPEYGKAITDPKTNFQVRKIYRDLKEKVKDSLKD